MEAGDSSVSVDLLLRALFALGVSRETSRLPYSVADVWLLRLVLRDGSGSQ
jgi:hypothetical protein